MLLNTLIGARDSTPTFFLKTFRVPPGYPGKISRQKLWLPWDSRDMPKSFGPHPFADPHATGRYPDPKVLDLSSFFLPDLSRDMFKPLCFHGDLLS